MQILQFMSFFKGNQENRLVIYDNKIIDYINFILRAGDFEDCSTDKVSFFCQVLQDSMDYK